MKKKKKISKPQFPYKVHYSSDGVNMPCGSHNVHRHLAAHVFTDDKEKVTCGNCIKSFIALKVNFHVPVINGKKEKIKRVKQAMRKLIRALQAKDLLS